MLAMGDTRTRYEAFNIVILFASNKTNKIMDSREFEALSRC